MLLQIPGILSPDQVRRFRARLDAARWIDGKVTAGHMAAKAKHNEQVPEESAEARELGEEILQALAASQLFMSAVLPKQVFPPLFNRYGPGMTFGNHIDGAFRSHPPTGVRIRTDVSATLFLTPPDDYDGGELLVEDTYGVQRVKLEAGSMVLYPATSLHRVEPVTRGTRVSSFFWVQSLVRDDAQRALLFDLDMAIVRLAHDRPGDPSLVSLTGVYNNLLRMWGQP
jgi:PKHD-type hydroxylase